MGMVVTHPVVPADPRSIVFAPFRVCSVIETPTLAPF